MFVLMCNIIYQCDKTWCTLMPITKILEIFNVQHCDIIEIVTLMYQQFHQLTVNCMKFVALKRE